MRFTSLFLLAYLSFLKINAQQFDIQNIDIDEGLVTVSFKVIPKIQFEKYDISLYGSHDDFQNQLTQVTGPSTIEAADPNQIYQLTWNAKGELKQYDGNIQLEIRGEVTYVPLNSNMMTLNAKMGKSAVILWNGGNPSDQIRIDLIKGGTVKETLSETPNTGTYTWSIPDMDKGSDYQVKLTNLSSPRETHTTKQFKIGSPMNTKVLLIGGGIAVVGAVVGVIVSSGGSDDKDKPLPYPDVPNN